MSSENNYHILWCFGDSSRKYCIWLFFFWPVSLVLIPYLFFSSPFSSLVLGCRHDEAFYFYFFILIPSFWNLLFCMMSQRYQFRLFLFGVNVVNGYNLKQIIFSINSVSCSSLLCFCSCSLSAYVVKVIWLQLFWPLCEKWSKKAQNTSIFLALPPFSLSPSTWITVSLLLFLLKYLWDCGFVLYIHCIFSFCDVAFMNLMLY